MANIMDKMDLKNHVHRNGFDLSARNLFTAKVGELLPVMCKEVIPGDTFDIDVRSLTRTKPVETAAFTRIREYYDFYFVPIDLMWDKWANYIIQTQQPVHARTITAAPDEFTSHPYFTMDDMLTHFSYLRDNPSQNEMGYSIYRTSLKLLQYLGYGSYLDTIEGISTADIDWQLPNLSLNPFPLLAYQKIYQDHFRFDSWETTSPFTCNLDYIFTNKDLRLKLESLQTADSIINNLFTLRYANYKKDLFTGLLPSPQFGDTAIAAPVTGDIVGSYSFVDNQNNYPKNGDVIFGNYGQLYDQNGQLRGNINIHAGTRAAGSTLPPNAAGLSVFALRQAEFLQKYREITGSGNRDYKEQLQKHWNVNPSDFQSYRSRYLGGTASNIVINEVVNQALASERQGSVDTNPEPNIKGTGRGSAHGHIKFHSESEYGILMCIYHAEPLLDWSAFGIDKLNTKVSAADYAIPEFDNLGMQPVISDELIFGLHKQYFLDAEYYDFNQVKPIGYAPRYYDYKVGIDTVRGDFIYQSRSWAAPMTVGDIIQRMGHTTAINFNQMMFKINPNILDSIFFFAASDEENTDQLHIGAYFDIKAVRNLSVKGIPY